MLVACLGFVMVAIGHSVLGERGVVAPLVRSVTGTVPFGVENFRRLVRIAWHLTSLAWAGLAIALVQAPSPLVRLGAGVVAVLSGLAVWGGLRGRHPAWVIFAVIGCALVHTLHSPFVAEAAGALAASALFAMAGVHVAWASGLKWGLQAALPQQASGARALSPGRGVTLGVAFALALAGALALMSAGLVGGPALVRPLAWAAACVFALRAVGDFNYAGLFKRVRGSTFAAADDLYFTPLCVALSAAFVFTCLG